jgi:hypothetical protein
MLVIKVRRGRLNFGFVMHRLRTADNVGKKGKIAFCFCHAQIKDSW